MLLTVLIAFHLCAAADPPFYADKSDLLYYLREDGSRAAIESASHWATRREHILQNMQLVMGPLPSPRATPPFELQILDETEGDGYTRKKILFTVESGDRLPAYFLIPNPPPTRAPAMVCLHQTTPSGKGTVVGLSDEVNQRYAAELAQRGYVTIAPDYPGFGEYSIEPYTMGYASATMKGIVNHMRCVDLLASLPEVDPERIGAIGHSLGGHNALFLAAFDERIKVAVSSCGFNSFAKYYGGDLTGWSHQGYMPRIATEYGKDPALMPFDWTEVLATIAPRHVFVSAPVNDANFEVSGVRDCENAAGPVFELLGVPENLQMIYPDFEHDFPIDIREHAYDFIDKVFAHSPR